MLGRFERVRLGLLMLALCSVSLLTGWMLAGVVSPLLRFELEFLRELVAAVALCYLARDCKLAQPAADGASAARAP